MTEVGTGNPVMVVMGLSCGLQFHGADNFRDVAWLGTCDDGCRLLAEKLGWKVSKAVPDTGTLSGF